MALRWLSELLHTLTGKREGSIVFLSYAHEAEQAVAELASDLRDDGIDVWFAPDDLRAGDQLNLSIKTAIKGARFFLLAVTPQSRNSAWVTSELEFALHQDPDRLTIIPLYVTSRETPAQLSDHKGIDLRAHVYKAGLRELRDLLAGRLPAGRTPLGEFESFVSSLPIVDGEVQEAMESFRLEYETMPRGPREGERAARAKEKVEAKLAVCERILEEKGYDPRDKERILESLLRRRIPPALLDSELQIVKAWLRVGCPETLAVAADAYKSRFIGWPSYRRILKSQIAHQINAWVERGELSAEAAPTPKMLVDKLVEEQLIRPFRRDEYINEPTDDLQEFHWAKRLESVGRAAYLFERGDK